MRAGVGDQGAEGKILVACRPHRESLIGPLQTVDGGTANRHIPRGGRGRGRSSGHRHFLQEAVRVHRLSAEWKLCACGPGDDWADVHPYQAIDHHAAVVESGFAAARGAGRSYQLHVIGGIDNLRVETVWVRRLPSKLSIAT